MRLNLVGGHAIPHFVVLVFTVWQMLLQRDFEPSSEQH